MKIQSLLCASVLTLGIATLAPSTVHAADKTIEVVNFSKLLPLLPEPPKGWTGDKAEGQTMATPDIKLTTVARHYRQGDDGPSANIQIVDTAANESYKEMTTAAWQFSQETTEGYTKGVKIDGAGGFETYQNDGKHGTLCLIVADRYFVQIEVEKLDAKELREWLKKLDLKKLAEVK